MNQNKKINLYGHGGHCNVVREIIINQGIEIGSILDDDPKKLIDENILPGVFSNPEFNDNHKNALFIICVGNNQIRKKIAETIKSPFASAIHSSAQVSTNSVIGTGSVICQHATIQTQTTIGCHVIVNTAASIDHDCQIDNFVHVAPSATLCGGVQVREGTLIGANATVLPNLKIGRFCKVGAGAVITKDIPDYATVVGSPGQIIKINTASESSRLRSIDHDLKQQLLNALNKILADANREPLHDLRPDLRLQQDLNLDSLQLAELTVLLEVKFNVDIFEDGIVEDIEEIIKKIEH